jgi:hypothetical protein
MSKRIREVFPRAQVAHLYANASQEHARVPGGNFYFHGDTAFSYRNSYAVAVRTPWKDADGRTIILMRRTNYSPTTAKHDSAVRSALRGHPVRVIDVGSAHRGALDPCSGTLAEIKYHGAEASAKARAAYIRDLLGFAQARALGAERRRDGWRCWDDYRAADRAIGDAHAIAHNAADAAERRALDRILDTDAPPVPGVAARGYSSYTADDCGEPALAFAADARKARKLADAKRKCADAVKTAREDSKRANACEKEPRSAGHLVALHETARNAWNNAAGVLAKAGDKPGAKGAKARADKHGRQAERSRPVADLETVRNAAESFHVHARYVIGKYAEGLHFRRHWREGFNRLPAVIRNKAGRAAEYRARTRFPDSLRQAKGRADMMREAVAGLRECLRVGHAGPMGKPGAQANYAVAQALVRLVRVASGRGALAGRARAAVDALRDAMSVGPVADAIAIGTRLERAAVAYAAEDAWAQADTRTGALTLENHEIMGADIDRAAEAAARAAQYWPERWDGRAKAAREAAHTVNAYRTIARAIANHGASSGFASHSVIRDGLKRAEDLLAAGMPLDAERNVGRALESCRPGRADDALGVLDRIASYPGHPATVYAVATREAARIRESVAGLAALEAEARALCDRIAPAATTARADIVSHWRATGEGLELLNAIAAPGFAYFRRGKDGSIVSSLGAIVPESAGRRLWAMIRAAVASGRGVDYGHNSGPRVGYFHVSSIAADGSAVVGCHRISATEARAFAEHMGWPPFGAETEADAMPVEGVQS